MNGIDKKVEDMSVIELKALLYDEVVVLERAKSNILYLENLLKNKMEPQENIEIRSK